ncbi:MAG: NAD(P)/FAD-dependent oxidoreductase [Gammaproteobacteria bacterium]|nr:NAD(P)/FAD-dependent oxidoreductase [Gammaproteobacteria bacterium]
MATSRTHFDAIVVGAGFGGMYMLHRLRGMGLNAHGLERGDDVGGTWYWNRYPGCRCDVESMEYSYQFSDDLQQSWQWTERYASQPEILRYASHVADRFELRDHITFNRSVTAARFREPDSRWEVDTDAGETVTAQFLIMATGCLSAANTPQFPGLTDYRGQQFHTGAWPQNGVDFSGERVAIIGTGSSAIQSIPLIAQNAAHLTVFQRTPNYSIPAQNKPLDQKFIDSIKANYDDLRARNKLQQAAFGANYPRQTDSILAATPEARERRLNEYWNHGGFMFLGAYADIGMNLEANAIAAEFVRNKIRSIVKDPETAALLCPTTVLGCKRLCADTGYFETFNRSNVSLVDVSEHPIDRLTANGIVTNGNEYAVDSIVFATGFDAMTGSLLRCDITGEEGLSLREKWAAGPRTYLGLMTAGFPNLFMMTGPGSPSVLANMITGVEQHADYIADFIDWSRQRELKAIVPEVAAEDEWVNVVNMRAAATLFPKCNSWYLGANVPGKPRVFMPYVGFPDYVAHLERIAARDYEGFRTVAA